jgi:hypothetical protein
LKIKTAQRTGQVKFTGPSVKEQLMGLAAFLAVLAVAVYLAPTLVAWARGVPHMGSIIVINIALGWTLIGWVIALAMATRS